MNKFAFLKKTEMKPENTYQNAFSSRCMKRVLQIKQ